MCSTCSQRSPQFSKLADTWPCLECEFKLRRMDDAMMDMWGSSGSPSPPQVQQKKKKKKKKKFSRTLIRYPRSKLRAKKKTVGLMGQTHPIQEGNCKKRVVFGERTDLLNEKKRGSRGGFFAKSSQKRTPVQSRMKDRIKTPSPPQCPPPPAPIVASREQKISRENSNEVITLAIPVEMPPKRSSSGRRHVVQIYKKALTSTKLKGRIGDSLDIEANVSNLKLKKHDEQNYLTSSRSWYVSWCCIPDPSVASNLDTIDPTSTDQEDHSSKVMIAEPVSDEYMILPSKSKMTYGAILRR
eukprot:jgi/Bigna1/69385/fgenesh1_pg.8_\